MYPLAFFGFAVDIYMAARDRIAGKQPAALPEQREPMRLAA